MPMKTQTYVWKGSNDLALTKWPINAPVKQMALGFYHSVFLTNDGKVFCCGQNTHGQLGVGTDKGSYQEPMWVACLDAEEITSVAVGSYHTVCGSISGNVYCWGDSSHCQCGSLETCRYTTPLRIASFDSPVKKVDCCLTSSVALLADGRLLAWGSGSVLQYTTCNKPQVLELSPFRFIEDRFVLDVSCGADFIVAVLKKPTTKTKTIAAKSSFVIVHKSDSQHTSFNSEEFNKELGEKIHCPLGLELTEEHVLVPPSTRDSPISLRKFLGRETRSSSINSRRSHVSSTESSVTCMNGVTHHQVGCTQEEVNPASKTRPRSLTSVSQQPVINVDTNEAEQWLKARIGDQFTVRASENSSITLSCGSQSNSSGSTAEGEATDSPHPATLEHNPVPPYMESMWHSITSSSQAVTSAMQAHIVPKIPYLEKLAPSSDSGDTSMSDSMALVPMLAMVESTKEDYNSNPIKISKQRSQIFNKACNALNNNEPGGEYRSASCIATEVWSWGEGEEGQLGHGDRLNRLQPSSISSLSDSQVYRVDCSAHTCFALTTSGKVYGWGGNKHGQVVYKDKSTVLQPTLISISAKKPVIDISLGVDHALLQVICPSNGRDKGDIFLTGASSQNALGSRLEFTKKLGHKRCMRAGPNAISSICVEQRAPIVFQALTELAATEIQLYRILLDILTELVEPILDSDYMAALIDSPYGFCLRNMVEDLFALVDMIGLNTQELCAVSDPEHMESASVANNHMVYLQFFTSYATHFHNLLAMNGITHLVDRVRIILLNNEIAITSILERCQLEFSDDLLVKVSILLQLPLRRINEYHELIETIQLNLEDGSKLVSCLTALEQEKVRLSTQYSLAESTRIFWDQCPRNISLALKEPHRRLVRESKSLSLNLIGASKLYKNVFVLFNDVFVHIQGSTHKVYPLEKLWIESGASEDHPSHEHEIKLITPEAIIRVEATNTSEKAEWMWMISQTVTAWLSNYKAEPIPANPVPNPLRTTPLVRLASHMFSKAGPLQGAVYNGKWYRGQMHGEGQLMWADGRVYTGQFDSGEISGYGKMTSKINGKLETMKGYWSQGKLHGFARTRFANGDSYIGFYRDNLYHGHGMLKQRSTMSIYVGEWKNGKRHGYGVMDSQGEKYLGQWCKDMKHGAGLHITLDDYYMEGNFSNNKLVGQGLVISSDDTYYEGTFTGAGDVNGKGTMVMNNGDSISGSFDGSWTTGIKVYGVYKKASYFDRSQVHPLPNLPKSFGTLSTAHDSKWKELFRHSKVALGINSGQLVHSDCEKAWNKVAVLFAHLRTISLKGKQKREYSPVLEKVPSHNLSYLSLEHLNCIRDYLCQACDSEFHPLGLLLKNLVDVYRASYSGTGTHRRLLMHAREELLSITYRYYTLIRILFPELPSDYSAKKIVSEAVFAAQRQQEAEVHSVPQMAVSSNHFDPLNEESGRELQQMAETDIVTPTLLIFPMFLPKIYEPLFHLYALQNETADEQYWNKLQRFNKQCDSTLFSYLGIPERFRISQEEEATHGEFKSGTSTNGCYSSAIESLQRLSTCFTPAEKLQVLQLTFEKLNNIVKASLSDDFNWTMDDLFPVFLFVVIRSRLRYLGSEIHFMDDLMDGHLEFGELGLMFTTLKACHLQIHTEKLI
ncbi:alsin-like [Watersipora subatra]|uniref:alsin-like n=1 Tax=Watersipora subatra TaxID=2589382 RepID=UPI00355BF62F